MEFIIIHDMFRKIQFVFNLGLLFLSFRHHADAGNERKLIEAVKQSISKEQKRR